MKEHLDSMSKVGIYCEILLGVLRMIPMKNYNDTDDYQKALNKKLKFESLDGDRSFRACIDLIEDTQSAILEFYKNGLSTEEKNFGEMYLRLYGILNAIYLQMQSIIELIELFKIPGKNKISTELKALEIIVVRNKLAAHTPNYSDDLKSKRKKGESYRLVQSELSKWGNELTMLSNHNNLEKVELIPLIKEFTERVECYLDIISEKAISSLFVNTSHKKDWLTDRLEYVRER